MKLATRINSFLPVYENDLKKVFEQFKQLGLGYVDLNYPEHIEKFEASEIKTMMEAHDLKLNGVALRFRGEFINGELGNADAKISAHALELCKNAADYCRSAGGKVVTIWLGFDGFDYSFQINYQKVWNQIRDAFIEIADYAPDLKISIEYKPFQPRAYAFIDSMGLAGMMLNEINRDNVGITLDYCHMLMKHENPAFAAEIFGSRDKLFGIHLNDGYGLNDDGLMIGSATPFKTLEFLYYIRKHQYDGVIYFDTFPVIENATKECEQNIRMITQLNKIIDQVGLNRIQTIIDKNDAIEANQLMLAFLTSSN
ncbi:sugar phosphate isomerase/epimerase family protein [Listeria ivanovii]|uniref:Sugar phosphate isomerase/epimerase n=2 Tax=Listeria ivanovii TaxID=1638 RepID=A0ABS1G2R8_LISIV|nr:sugar phosphate isomerase/epimerase family protein [Listeria ivanovii]EFR98251.1 AP endonuclease [Listeria ivanovii FSL F6-596]AIS58982.1 AP endonuclease [Listeria ivanovii subsp. londoniensis]AIS61784.1 AP endonuclease [Listeria ivanovii subsp. londoniensis]MBC2254635.1 sugar phosphate isomerase/epimerase [Listeria ivanovii]MBK1961161.1 sugar phosphate isomerase/epimerase [Listeria ivanovii subsp. londoniensis]